MGSKIVAVAVPVVLGVSMLGCGSSNKPKATPKEGPPSAELQGRYSTTLKKSDLPPKLPQKFKGQVKWQLLLAPSGGVNNTPRLVILNRKHGVLESDRLGVDRDTLLLHGEICTLPKGQVESIYRWHLVKQKLTILPFKNGCQDNIAEAILTAQPWKKTK